MRIHCTGIPQSGCREDKCLVAYEPTSGRYHLLETVRQYSRDRLLDSSEIQTWRGRHTDFFQRLTEEMWKERNRIDAKALYNQFETEHDNIRAALDWCLHDGQSVEAGVGLVRDLAEFWDVRGYVREGRNYMRSILSRPEAQVRTMARAKALYNASILAYQDGDYTTMRATAEEALTIAREFGNNWSIADALNILGAVSFHEANYTTARSLWEESIVYYQKDGNQRGVRAILGNLGNIALELGDYERARFLYQESRNEGTCWANLARKQGDYREATRQWKIYLTRQSEVNNRTEIAASLEGLAGSIAELGDAERAAHLFGAAHALREEIHSAVQPHNRKDYDRGVDAARASLGEEAFTAAWEEGRAMTLEQAIEYALQDEASS